MVIFIIASILILMGLITCQFYKTKELNRIQKVYKKYCQLQNKLEKQKKRKMSFTT